MLSAELQELRAEAHAYLQSCDRPCAPQTVARHIFGAQRHEDPVAVLLVRAILEPMRRVGRAHDGRWLAYDAPFLDIPLAGTRMVAVDLETTGSLTGVDRIIEVGMAALERGQVVKQFSSLCHSSRRVSPRIRRLTGIKPSQLKEAPTFAEVAPTIVDMLRGAHAFVAHDVRFDMPFLRWELERHGLEMPDLPAVCTLQLARSLWPDLHGWRLQDLAGTFAVAHTHPHRAGEDALATAGVLARALAAVREHGAKTLGDLYFITSAQGDLGAEDDLLEAGAAG
jgi:DNA polymerase III epsilon subunit family exonuclease